MSKGTSVSLLLLISLVMVTAAWMDDSSPANGPSTPPVAPQKPVEDVVQNHRIVDPYRWLEDAKSPETQKWVEQEAAYTRTLLDPLPGREQLHARLSELMSIGSLSAPQLGGPYYFYTKREGTQNQPVLLVREGVHGIDRVLVDVNQLAADGTLALDWWLPSDDGKYVTYGTSPSGSEISTLHIIETATGKLLPDSIERTRAASIAWKLDNSGFFYTRYPNQGEVPAVEELYHRRVFYHALGSNPANDPLIFGKDLGAEDWPGIDLSNDGRWLLITVEHGWTKSELYVQDLASGKQPVRVTEDKNFLYSGQIYNGKIFITTNEDAPKYRLFVVDAASPARANWKETIPESDAIFQGAAIVNGELLAEYEKNASSQLKMFHPNGQLLGDVQLPQIGTISGIGGKWNRK